MGSRTASINRYKPRHHRGWRRARDRRRWVAGGSLEGMLAVIPSLPRPALSRLVHRAIDRIDEIDGDPDLEANDDELDGSMGEDEFCVHNANWRRHPGCPIADPPEDDTEDRCEAGDDGCSPFWLNGVRLWGYSFDVG